ncbi:hypothetical protein AU468_12650 [Alkalispirochaeta sphaeroplastigenens]|uniref:Aspartokinase n=1 Tax=Alkalispirochaeta sphaeroplastigenens TaxID=1187066 RepID=A0A2S4JGR2_9SPIO|nr:hypothetical protein AU468_12650 [Alkalispirochaeta sphaeroplastigenens]
MKFGGTSVKDAHWIGNTLKIAEERLDQAPLLVSSAMAGVTDTLIGIAQASVEGQVATAQALLEELTSSHREALEQVTSSLDPDEAGPWKARLEELLDDLAVLVEGMGLVHEASPRSRDALLAFGELLSTTIIAAAARARGIPATLLDSRELVLTSTDFGAARPDLAETTRRITSRVSPRPGHLYIAQGFIGSTSDEVTTTLGRSGSDFSATIFGAALEAEQVEIWTDVDGIMTSDPRVVASARTIPEISYSEAAELAYFGARVIHPATLVPAVERDIPVLVCNTHNPGGPKTRILRSPSRAGLRAIAGRRGVTIITVFSSRMLNTWGFLSRMFRVFETNRVSVDLIATSEVSVSVSLDLPDPPPTLLQELAILGSVQVDRDKAVFSLVGEGMWKSPERIRDVFDSVASVFSEPAGVEMISLGSSETNLSLVIPQDQLDPVMKEIHRRFFTPA